jgi:sulfite oxidase
MSSTLDYTQDPNHDSLQLIVRKEAPFNAEPAPTDLVKNYITPEKYFFCRNHGPLPNIEEAKHTIIVEGIGCKNTVLTMKDIKENYEKTSVMMVMQCAVSILFYISY